MKHIWRIFKFTKELRKLYVSISIFTILLALMSQLQPLLTKAAIDEFTRGLEGADVNLSLVAMFAGLIFLTDFGQTIISNISGHIGDMMGIRVKQLMSERYYSHLMTLPQRYFDQELSGKIINRMSRGINQIGDFLQVMSNNFLQFIFSTVFSLIIISFYSWQVALMLASLYPIFIYMTAKTSNTWQKYQTKINEDLDIASGRFAESITQVKDVKSFVQEARELRLFGNRYRKVVNTTKPQSTYWHKQDIARRVVLNLIFLLVFMYIFIETGRGVYTIGEMVLLIQYAMLIRIPIFSISFIIDRTQRAISDSKDYFAVMDERPFGAEKTGVSELVVTNGAMEFQDVSFSYDTKQPVLKNISLTIEPGTKVALVGESGEGKTTLTNLILRLYEPEKGIITIDGQNIQLVSFDSLRRSIGVVFQDPALFSGSVYENIAYANPGVSEKQVLKAAKAANAHEFISKFTDGYKTEIGERGLKLSGGQKQRIAIARAILKNPPILMLDEATSSLDSKSEALVQEALARLMEGRTTIIIAHRLSTIQKVDQIVTLKNGRIDEIGSPRKLAVSGGVYQQLLNLQRDNQNDKTVRQLKKFEITG